MASGKKILKAIKVNCSFGLSLSSVSNLRALIPNCGLLKNDFTYFLDKAKSQG